MDVGDGGQGQNRTADTRIFSPLLYRLSYLAASATNTASNANRAPSPGVQVCKRAKDSRQHAYRGTAHDSKPSVDCRRSHTVCGRRCGVFNRLAALPSTSTSAQGVRRLVREPSGGHWRRFAPTAPEVVVPFVADARTQRHDVVRAGPAPAHAGALQSLPDQRPAGALHHARTDQQPHLPVRRVAHPAPVVLHVSDALVGGLVAGVPAQFPQHVVHAPLGERRADRHSSVPAP